MQARIAQSEAEVEPGKRIRMRIGVHVADVISDDLDLYGDGVNLAARLRDLGGPEEIIISAAIRDQLADGLGVTIEDLGERSLKGVERPMRVFRALPPGPAAPHRRLRHAGASPFPVGNYQCIPCVSCANAICSGVSCASPSFLPAAAAESGNMLNAVLSRICVSFGAMA